MNRALAARPVVAAVALHHSPLAVHVGGPYPVGQGSERPVLVPSLRRHVEVVVGAEELLAAAPVGGVRVEDLARVVLEEDAVAGEILKTRLDVAEVVVAAPGRDLLGREGDVEVVVEVRAVGRDPAKAPSHPRAHGLDLVDGGARHHDVAQIVVLEVHEQARDMIDLERAAHALRDLAGSHHEVLDEELAPAVEQIGEADLALRRVEDVLLLDPDPRQLATQPVQLVALLREGLLARQELHALLDPLRPGNDSMRLHGHSSPLLARLARGAGRSARGPDLLRARSLVASRAARPPVVVAPTRATVTADMHAGHMGSSLHHVVERQGLESTRPDQPVRAPECRAQLSPVARAIAPSTSTRVPIRSASSSTSKPGLWCMPLEPSARAPPRRT